MTEAVAQERWAAIESNPEVLTELCHRLGASDQFEVVDVFSLDPEMLSFIPRPVLALYLLFPSRSDGERTMSKFTPEQHRLSGDIFYLDQCDGHLDNACGTIAVIHSLLNHRDMMGLSGSDAPIEQYYQRTKDMKNFKERGMALDADQKVAEIHNSLVVKGQSRPVSCDKICHHFVSVIERDNHLVELDGAYNDGPYVVEELKGDFLESAVEFIKKKYMDRICSIQFSLMALVVKS